MAEMQRRVFLTFLPPELGDLSGGLMQPVLVSSQPDHFNGSKPVRRAGSGVAQRCQFAYAHQNLNVTLRETEQFRRGRNGFFPIKPLLPVAGQFLPDSKFRRH